MAKKVNKPEAPIKKFGIDMNDWWEQIKEDDVAIFERFHITQNRSLIKNQDEEDEEDAETMDEDMGNMVESRTIALYQTPWGPVKVPEFCDINKHFKLWTMYTKKPIGERLKNSINSLSGVESLEILTPYRARIGICPLYKDGQVLNNILSAIKNSARGLENTKTH